MASLIYLDTHVVAWLYAEGGSAVPAGSAQLIEETSDIRISPMVRMELQYLYEIECVTRPALAAHINASSGGNTQPRMPALPIGQFSVCAYPESKASPNGPSCSIIADPTQHPWESGQADRCPAEGAIPPGNAQASGPWRGLSNRSGPCDVGSGERRDSVHRRGSISQVKGQRGGGFSNDAVPRFRSPQP